MEDFYNPQQNNEELEDAQQNFTIEQLEALEQMDATEGMRLFEALLIYDNKNIDNKEVLCDIIINKNLGILANRLLKQNSHDLKNLGYSASTIVRLAKTITINFVSNPKSFAQQTCDELKNFQDGFVEILPKLGRADIYIAYLPFFTLLPQHQQEEVMWGIKSQGTEFAKNYIKLTCDYNSDTLSETSKIESSAQRVLTNGFDRNDFNDLANAGLNKDTLDDLRQMPMPKRPETIFDPMFG